MPGETVFSSVTKSATGTNASLAKPKVMQFTAATGGTGRGNFQSGTESAADYHPYGVTLGDVDGDGDLDMLTPAFSSYGFVKIMLNGGDATGSNTGIFSNGTEVSVGVYPTQIVLGDVDGDGDLDMVTANHGVTNSSTVSIRLNGGDATGSNTGIFSKGTDINSRPNAIIESVALGDIDGDGDLDALVVDYGDTAITLINGGNATGSNTGVFSRGNDVYLGYYYNVSVAAGDVDGDGDLDLVAASEVTGKVNVVLNGGDATGSNTGVFSNRTTLDIPGRPYSIALGDVDGDNDLDLVVANEYYGTVAVRLNGGDATGSSTGVFSKGADIPVGGTTASIPLSVALGDVDGDGDLDFISANSNANSASVRLNGGDATGSNTGVFSGGSDVVTGKVPDGIAIGDLDGDGDLDFVTANHDVNTVSARLNQPRTLSVQNSSLQPVPNIFVILPNIVDGNILSYNYSGLIPLNGATLDIYAITGQHVGKQVNSVAAAGTLSIDGLSSGWYVLRLSTATSTYSARFFKM